MFKKQVTQVTQVTQNGGECRSQKGNSGSADEGTGEPPYDPLADYSNR